MQKGKPMYDGRFGTVQCMICDKDIEPGAKDAEPLYDGEGIAPPANALNWMCDEECVSGYADQYYG